MKAQSIRLIVILSVSTFVLFFQNCKSNLLSQDSKLSSNEISHEYAGGGNGDPYGGKIVYYAFSPGHVCVDDNGIELPSELARIVENNGQYSLDFQNCKKKSQTLLPSDFNLQPNGNDYLIFQGIGFVKQLQPPRLQQRDFKFPIATCRETAASMHLRAGGVPEPLQPGQSRIENHIEMDLVSNWYGERSAKVVSVDVTQMFHDPQEVPIMIPPVLLWIKEFFNLDYEATLSVNHWWNAEFDFSASPMLGAPKNIYKIGSLSIKQDGQDTFDAEFSCVQMGE